MKLNDIITEEQKQKFGEDIFNRQHLAKKLCELICGNSADVISPLVLDGPWGCGKSIQAFRIFKEIEDNYAGTHKCIYWNASSSDNAADPLPMFVAALYNDVPAAKKDEFEKTGLSLCEIGRAIITDITCQGLKGFSFIDLKEIDASVKEVSRRKANPLLIKFRYFLEQASSEQKRIEAARKIMELVQDNKELIIIIDELDRCRPDFALKMVESIKHLFSVPKCKFILVMNKKILGSFVQNIYGLAEGDSTRYVDKFLKSSFILPIVHDSSVAPQDCRCLYFEACYKKGSSQEKSLPPFLITVIYKIIVHLDIQLREIEKILATLNMVKMDLCHELYKNFWDDGILIILSTLAVHRGPELQDFFLQKITSKALLEEVGLNLSSADMPNHNYPNFYDSVLTLLEAYWKEDYEKSKLYNSFYKKYQHPIMQDNIDFFGGALNAIRKYI